MKLHEAPKLPRGEKLPNFVEAWTDEQMGALRYQASMRHVIVEEYFQPGEIEKLWSRDKNGLLFQALHSIAEQAYTIATKEIEKEGGVYVAKQNRMRLNDEKDGLKRISPEKRKERFEFLTRKIMQGMGFGHEVSITTLLDAIIQDTNQRGEESIIKNELKRQIAKNKKFPNANTLLFKLLEQHRNKIKIESKLTHENVDIVPPVFTTNEDGSPKKYSLEDLELEVHELTEPTDLEWETYTQDICIGDDQQGYKKSLVEGDMKFFSVGHLFDEPLSIVAHLLDNVGQDALDYYSAQENYVDTHINENTYYSVSKQTNPDIEFLKARRHPLLTISAYVNGKNITFDQFKMYKDVLLSPSEKGIFSNLFVEQILPDICKKLQAQGYIIKGFGDDLKNLVEPRKVLVPGKGNISILDIEQGDLCIPKENYAYEIPSDITKEKLKILCESGISVDIKNIASNRELMDSIEQVDGKLVCSDSLDIEMNNLRYARSIKFPYSQKVILPELEALGVSFDETDILAKVEELDLRKLKVFKGNLHSTVLKSCRFDSLERIGGSLWLDTYPDASFPKLKSCRALISHSVDKFYNLPELEEVEGPFTSSCHTYTLPKIKKIGGKGAKAEIKNIRNVNFPLLEELHTLHARPVTEDVESVTKMITNLFVKKSYILNMPRLNKINQYSLWGITHVDFSSLNLDNKQSYDLDGGIYVGKDTKIICANKEEFIKTGFLCNANPTSSLLKPNPNNFFSSRRDFANRTGKSWNDL